MVRLCIAALAYIVPVYASAHSWYDPWCCSGDPITGDCKPIAAGEVTERPDGYHFREFVIPYAQARVSVDRDFHWCEFPKGTLRCFYAPHGGS